MTLEQQAVSALLTQRRGYFWLYELYVQGRISIRDSDMHLSWFGNVVAIFMFQLEWDGRFPTGEQADYFDLAQDLKNA